LSPRHLRCESLTNPKNTPAPFIRPSTRVDVSPLSVLPRKDGEGRGERALPNAPLRAVQVPAPLSRPNLTADWVPVEAAARTPVAKCVHPERLCSSRWLWCEQMPASLTRPNQAAHGVPIEAAPRTAVGKIVRPKRYRRAGIR